MVQLVKHLPGKHENLNLDSFYLHKKPGLVTCTCHPSSERWGTDKGLQFVGQPTALNQGLMRDFFSNNKVESDRGRHQTSASGLNLLAHMCTHTYACLCMSTHVFMLAHTCTHTIYSSPYIHRYNLSHNFYFSFRLRGKLQKQEKSSITLLTHCQHLIS